MPAKIPEEAKCKADPPRRSGIYIHVPFCLKKCRYCDFYSITDPGFIESYLNALSIEIRHLSGSTPAPVDSIYFGGGTPSLLTPGQIGRIIGECKSAFDILPDSEITLEMNPKTADEGVLTEYRASGINRINIGVQSLEAWELEFLGRIHAPSDAEDAIQWVKVAVFDNYGVDLIYGIPGQTVESWTAILRRIVEFSPNHISCYMLTYEPGTPLDLDLRSKKIRKMSEELAAHLFLTTDSILEEYGYDHYEISNFAQRREGVSPGARSLHNRKYWTFSPYLGLGPGAHSFIGDTRFWNVKDLDRYMHLLSRGELPVCGKEVLSREQQALEMIYLGLRTREGISARIFEAKIGISFHETFSEIIQHLLDEKMIIETPESCALSPKGMLFHESISRRFAERLPIL
ncbi:MAG: radical SAM family heme chaperone HemW [Thermodesulfobacteriota bacterium]